MLLGMEMCYLRGDRRPGDFGEPGIDKDGPGAKHEKQEKVRGLNLRSSKRWKIERK